MVTGRAARPGRASSQGPEARRAIFFGPRAPLLPPENGIFAAFCLSNWVKNAMQHYNYNSHIFIHKLHYYPMYILLKYQSNFVFAAALNCCCLKRFPQKPMQKSAFQHSNNNCLDYSDYLCLAIIWLPYHSHGLVLWYMHHMKGCTTTVQYSFPFAHTG